MYVINSDYNSESEFAAEGIAVGDGLFHLRKGDALILTSEIRFSKESMDELHRLTEKYGVETIILNQKIKPVGVIEHDKLD